MAGYSETDSALDELHRKAGLGHNEIQRLRHAIAGDVITDRLSIIAYSQSAAMYELPPSLIIAPRDADDVQAAVAYARRHGFPIVGRGGGSSLAGQVLTRGGMVIDFTKYMNAVHDFDPKAGIIDVGPGLRLDELTRFLNRHRMFFPPDPASGRAATIGGMAANNSAGSRSVKYGSTREWLTRLHLVLSDSSTAIAERFELGGKIDSAIQESGGLWAKIIDASEKLISENADIIARNRPKPYKNSSGYLLYDVLDGYSFDPVKMLTGSEGTLALFTRLRLQVLPTPQYRRMSLSFYADIHTMARAVNAALEFNPVMLEMMDAEYIRLAKERSSVITKLVPDDASFVLIIEFEGESSIDVSRVMHNLEERLLQGDTPLATGFVIAESSGEREDILEIRRASNNIMNRTRGSRKPSDVIEDTAVSPSDLEEYLVRLQDLLSKLETKVIMFGHVGNGNLHIRPVLDLKKEGDLNRMVRLATGVAEIVKGLRGTLSGEHGDGRLRTPLLKEFFPEMMPVFREMKRIFDPTNVFNPGIIVCDDDMSPSDIKEDTKFGPEYTFADTRSILDTDKTREEIEACHACGYCRDFCPSYAASGDELDTPRAWSAVLRHIISGKLPADSFGDADLGRMISSCLGCRRCERLCYAESGFGKVSLDARVVRGEKKAPSWGERAMANIPWIARLRSHAPGLFDRLIKAPWARNAMGPVTGAASERPLPEFDKSPLAKMHPRKDVYANPAKLIALFHGCHAGYIDVVGEGEPGFKLLEELGFDVLIPEQGCCGLPKISINDVEGAREDAENIVKSFLPLVERGMSIVTTCPSCAHYLKDDLKYFVEPEVAAKISSAVKDINEIVLNALSKDDAPELILSEPMRLAVHVPCHTSAYGGQEDLLNVLRKIKGLLLIELSDNCCGMGGSWGLKERNAKQSLKLGRERAKEIQSADVDTVITPCGMCALQLRDIAGVKTVHPVKLIMDALKAGKEKDTPISVETNK